MDGDTEHLAPHGLKLDGDSLVELPLAVEIGHKGEAPPLRIACLGQLAARFRGVLGQSRRRAVTRNARRHEAQGIGLSRAGYLGGDAAAIEGHGEGLADAGIGEGSLGAVEAQEIGSEERCGVEIGVDLERIQERGRGESLVHDQVGQTGGVEVVGDIRLADRKNVDGGEPHMIRIPVGGVFFQTNRIVDSPILQNEGPVADEIARLHPVVAILGDQIGADGEECGKGAEIKEVGRGLTEGDAQRRFIQRLHTDLGKIGCFSAAGIGKLLRTRDGKELVAVGRSRLRIERPAPGVDEVPCGDPATVAPA